MKIATTPIIGNDGVVLDTTPDNLKPALALSMQDAERQRRIVAVRAFDAGRHGVLLTERLERFLGASGDQFAPRLNFTSKIAGAVAERLVIEGFTNDAPDDAGQAAQSEFADGVWRGSRMKGKRAKMFQDAVRDGEYFILIDYDSENKRARWTPHKRYLAPELGGDGEGMFFAYPDGDVDRKPEYAVKRWAEIVREANGAPRAVPRVNLYFADRIEKYANGPRGWALIEQPAWFNRDGSPLGIAAVHIKTPTLEPAATEAIPIQKGLNKTYIDMLAAADMEAFRVLIALGWDPTDNGKVSPKIEAGTWMYTTEEGGSVQEVAPSDSTRFIGLIDKQIALMSDVTNTPLTLLQRSNQRAAEGTLQEEKESFVAKVRDYAETIEMAFEDALKIARRVQNAFGDGPALSEDADFAVQWQAFTTRSTDDRTKEAAAMLASGYTIEEVQRKVWNEDEAVIERMAEERNGSGLPALAGAEAGL